MIQIDLLLKKGPPAELCQFERAYFGHLGADSSEYPF
jgi:hypothetical protein